MFRLPACRKNNVICKLADFERYAAFVGNGPSAFVYPAGKVIAVSFGHRQSIACVICNIFLQIAFAVAGLQGRDNGYGLPFDIYDDAFRRHNKSIFGVGNALFSVCPCHKLIAGICRRRQRNRRAGRIIALAFYDALALFVAAYDDIQMRIHHFYLDVIGGHDKSIAFYRRPCVLAGSLLPPQERHERICSVGDHLKAHVFFVSNRLSFARSVNRRHKRLLAAGCGYHNFSDCRAVGNKA